ncbi:hypothetical protein FRACA_520002 [Frankia canadensis]|uniref:Uncharacterized protein n=1 Tax=Frankia canadensis TaxID=1836972 RepID=A0A2I2KYK2_9ACTN|nr:hypothetical protein FRACA_520002 [Frankia canadensis]SOU58027.1 hypothetical protein FRACA_520002 [Frankia canadensis]
MSPGRVVMVAASSRRYCGERCGGGWPVVDRHRRAPRSFGEVVGGSVGSRGTRRVSGPVISGWHEGRPVQIGSPLAKLIVQGVTVRAVQRRNSPAVMRSGARSAIVADQCAGTAAGAPWFTNPEITEHAMWGDWRRPPHAVSLPLRLPPRTRAAGPPPAVAGRPVSPHPDKLAGR